jgi:hypothetical protein
MCLCEAVQWCHVGWAVSRWAPCREAAVHLVRVLPRPTLLGLAPPVEPSVQALGKRLVVMPAGIVPLARTPGVPRRPWVVSLPGAGR